MKRLLFAVLKLLAQTLIFVLTGEWPHWRASPTPRPKRREPVRARRTFEARGSAAGQPAFSRAMRDALAGEASIAGARAGGVGRGSPARAPGAASAPAPRTLAAAVRDRNSLRAAVALGAALGPRPGGRPR